MEPDPKEVVLGNHHLLGEILLHTGSSKSFIRAGNVNNQWYDAAKSPAILDLFASRNDQSFVGFVVEYKTFQAMQLQLMQPLLAPGNETLVALQAGLDADSFSKLPVLACNGARVLYVVKESVLKDGAMLCPGYYARCPFSSFTSRRWVGDLIPPIPQGGEHRKNTFGQFGILMQTGRNPSSPMSFFVKEFDSKYISPTLYAGVRFNCQDPVVVHVAVLVHGVWERFVSEPIESPHIATFHRNPYSVLVGTKLFMMYLVDSIVCFDIERSSFTVVPLPGDMPEKALSWFDYSVSKGVHGGLALAHFRDGNIDRWFMSVNPQGFTWRLESTFKLAPAFGALVQNMFTGAQLIDVSIEWGSLQLRSASQGCRYVFMSIDLNSGLYIADTVEKTVIEVPNVVRNGSLGRIFKLEESWPPML